MFVLLLRTLTTATLTLACGFAQAAPGDLDPDFGASTGMQRDAIVGMAGQATATSSGISLENLAIPFERNAGQHDARVAFDAALPTGRLFVTHRGELVYSMPARDPAAEHKGWTLTERFVAGSPRARAGASCPTRISRFVGSESSRWQSDRETFASVELGQVWRGIGVELRASGNNVEKIYTVAPHGRAESISMRVDGASRLRVDASGALVASTGLGEVSFSPPIAFQEHDGVREPVRVAYRLDADRYGFELGHYDRSRPLVIDPVLQATYSGGSGVDSIHAFAVATSGDIYATGWTNSTDFPGTAGGAQASGPSGTTDVFIARFNASLTSLLQATYFGGSLDDYPTSIALNATDVYIGGGTDSQDLPNTTGAAVPVITGVPCSPFLARLPLALTSITRSTWLTATTATVACFESDFETKRVNAIALSASEIYAAGNYTETEFPEGQGVPAVPLSGAGFVTRLDLALSTIHQSSGIGTSGGLFAADALAVTAGDVHVAGLTNQDITGTAGGAYPALESNRGYIMRLNAALTAVQQSTYVLDAVAAMRVSGGELFVTGSTRGGLPATTGGAQPTFGGGFNDVFLARFNSALTANPQATYLGGSGNEYGVAILAALGGVYVTGVTQSTDFPNTAGGIEPTICTSTLCTFVSRLTPTLTSTQQSTYYGGPAAVQPSSLAANASEVIVGGVVLGNGLPGAVGGAQPIPGLEFAGDGFLVRLSPGLLGVEAPCDQIFAHDFDGPDAVVCQGP